MEIASEKKKAKTGGKTAAKLQVRFLGISAVGEVDVCDKMMLRKFVAVDGRMGGWGGNDTANYE